MGAKFFLLVVLMMASAVAVASMKAQAAPSAKTGKAFAASPSGKVVKLLQALKSKVEGEGKSEQEAYDKYACWVEDKLNKKAAAISDAKALISDLGDKILKLNAQIGTHEAEVKNAKKNIADNIASTKEATALRKKENGAYNAARVESENSIDSLGSAVKTLTGAGEFMSVKTRGFKKNVHEAQLLSVAAGLRQVLQSTQAQAKLSASQVDVVTRFVENPQEYSSRGLIAAQTGQNPFGDYAPASDQIQGILKDMHDSMSADLKQDIKDETASQAEFDKLKATKASELKTLKDGLQLEEKGLADKTEANAAAQDLRDKTADELESDEEFFANTKEAAEAKATEWSTRTKTRIEELTGIQGAIDILKGGMKDLVSAGTTFLQLKATTDNVQYQRDESVSHVKALVTQHQTSNLKKVLALMQSGGHFDAVMSTIDKMMTTLREEEQDDIEHRDRCQEKENDNSNDIADANAGVKKNGDKLKRQRTADKQLTQSIKMKEADIESTKKTMKELLDNRNEDKADFQYALKMDGDAAVLVGKARGSLAKYYSALQVEKPKYSTDPDEAPETEFASSDKHQGEATGIVAILDMIVEDFEKEMAEGKADEAKAQAEYDKQEGSLQKSLDAQNAAKVSLEEEQAALGTDMTSTQNDKDAHQGDLDEAKEVKKAVAADCSWVGKRFADRRKKRKAEMDGLVDAKDFLSGVAEGRAVLPR